MPESYSLSARDNPVEAAARMRLQFQQQPQRKHSRIQRRVFIHDGYPLHSPSPYRLWFAFRLSEVQVNYPVMGNRIDGHSLLCQAQEKFASTL